MLWTSLCITTQAVPHNECYACYGQCKYPPRYAWHSIYSIQTLETDLHPALRPCNLKRMSIYEVFGRYVKMAPEMLCSKDSQI